MNITYSPITERSFESSIFYYSSKICEDLKIFAKTWIELLPGLTRGIELIYARLVISYKTK